MAFKFLCFLAVVVVARAGVVSYEAPSVTYTQPIEYSHQPAHAIKYASVPAHAPLVKTVVAAKHVEDYDANPQYSFAYDVQDGLTGDSKSQHETRNGDVVEGHYSLIDADGHKRTVHYTADSIHGFNAQVHREPLHAKTIVSHAAPVVHKVVSTPIIAKVATPVVHHAAPITKVYSAPIIHSAPLVKTVAPSVVHHHQPAVISHSPIVAHSPAYYHH